ncbi:MAG: phage terminase large subunit [Acidaminobacter sp.]|uniref:phage terminase large subunit n=1 Tax=Acidaminobacter sp. TaxID=1872102 RepID=UPI001385D150|nr:phage terminase large subunit [Acidaminobacter sp.]MZQ99490.1 phage terminase large subunit [Acidaminobacter sp.]
MKIPSLDDVRMRLAQIRYWEYVKYVHRGRWIEAPYLIYICDMVQSFLEGSLKGEDGTEIMILCISLPPQHGKSMSITETLPSWVLGKYKTWRVIEVSYNEDFARKFGRRNKEKINEFGEKIFGVRVSKVTSAQDEWELDNGIGSMLSRGVGGSITGNPGDLILIDDPVKNRQEAESEVYRERVWDEWLNSIRTRLSAKGKTIVIMTRWHEDDLVARILKNEGKRAMYINLPCEAEENDPLMREPGEALGSVLGKDNAWLTEFKPVYLTKEGSRVWQSLFQGRPTAAEGNLFKRSWFRFYAKRPEYFDEIIQSWDCAFKDSDGSDFVSGQVWGRIGAEYYLLDCVTERLDLPDTCSAIMQMTAKWPKSLIKLVEDKANGPAVIQLLQTRIPGLIPINPEGGKIARANAVSPAFESGNVFLPDADIAPWVVEYMDELCAFPSGAHDDRVDSTTQALNRLIYYTDHRDPPLPPPKDAEEALARRVDEHLDSLIRHKQRKKGGFRQV